MNIDCLANMSTEPWLDRWIGLLTSRTRNPAILELGCGPGRDTAYLARHGFTRLTATDLSAGELAACRSSVPGAQLIQHDLRHPLPFADGSFDVVLASLCLHYFDWEATRRAVGEIHRALVEGGVLLCRVNSTKDLNFGAVGHPEVAHHYYDVDGRMKRFFSREDIDALFGSGWERLAVEEKQIERYEKAKVVWEVVVRKG